MYDCIIVGGGISGVSFAHYLRKEGKSVLIIERESQLGGRIRTAVYPEAQGFWAELGAHTCYNSYTELIKLVQDSGHQDKFVALASLSYMLYNKKKIKSVFSEISFLSMAFQFWKFFSNKKEGKTTREYFLPIVGRGNYDRLFSKLFRAVISQEADDYPAEIFLKKRVGKNENISRRFSYEGGFSQMIHDVAMASGSEIHTSDEVTGILKDKEGFFEVKTRRGESFRAAHVALASEVNLAAELLAGILSVHAIGALSAVKMSKSVSINLLIEKHKLKVKKMAGIIPLTNDFFSAVSRDTIDDETWRSFSFHFPESKIPSVERLETMFRILDIHDDKFFKTEIYRHQLPSMRLSDLRLGERLSSELHDSGVFLLGNYFEGMSLEDCVRRSKTEAERYFEEEKKQ